MELTPTNLAAAILPFANEITNILTQTGFTLNGFKLYDHHAADFTNEGYSKLFMDTIALSGIALNAAKYGEHYGELIGWCKGVVLILFTFVFPNLFMGPILEVFKTNISNNKFIILSFGFIIIYLLDLLVGFITCIIKKKLIKHRYDKHVK